MQPVVYLFTPEYWPMPRQDIQATMSKKHLAAFGARPLNTLLVPVAVPVLVPVSIPRYPVKLVRRFLWLRDTSKRQILNGECVSAKSLPQQPNKSL